MVRIGGGEEDRGRGVSREGGVPEFSHSRCVHATNNPFHDSLGASGYEIDLRLQCYKHLRDIIESIYPRQNLTYAQQIKYRKKIPKNFEDRTTLAVARRDKKCGGDPYNLQLTSQTSTKQRSSGICPCFPRSILLQYLS